MENIKVGYIGLGGRGRGFLEYFVLPLKEEIAAVCDLYEDRAVAAADLVEETTGKRPDVYLDYKELLKDPEINTVIISTAWETHIPIAIDAMKAGKAVAMEVGGANAVEDCFRLVSTQEETGMPFMMLENCCFDRREMMVMNMVKQGLFGEVVHCSGGYMHDLRGEVTRGRVRRHYRLRNYMNRNCENYPTHALGPIAKVLDINRGNRMMTLSSTASKSAGLKDYIARGDAEDKEFLKDKEFAQGDIVTTVIKCARGETIVLTLDTTLPRYYSRGFTVRGTRGLYEECTDSIFLDTPEFREREHEFYVNKGGRNAGDFEEEYDHPMWKKYLEEGVKEEHGHGGMDHFVIKLFFEALRNGTPMPVDVYDAAAWMAVTALSEQSIPRGGAVVDFPDFTHGKWILRAAEEWGSL